MMPSVVGVAASVGPCALTKSKEGYVSDQQPTINIHQRNGASIWPQKATHQLSTLSESKALWDSTALITPSQVHPATNGGSCGSPLPLVYALGTIGYDFGSEVRRDAITQHMAGTNPNPSDPAQFLTYLGQQPYEAAAVIWTLNLDVTTIYAIRPAGPYASLAYERLREFLNAQLTEGVQLVATPGFLLGTVTLLSGQNVPQLVPDLRGMASWSTGALVQAVLGTPPEQEALRTTYEQQQSGITNFLQRVYYDLRNLGLSPQERAINYAATNAFQVERVFEQAVSASLALDSITVERSTVCRPDSDCWDVKLIFFNPTRRLEQARRLYRFTVDVSDVVPVTVGPVRSWFIY
jgi:cyanobactin maturation PatA/PatG family protease